ncbi:FxsA family protein [uncultured Halomonas sp.]|uniref:FxsA family protein n=1 Tax=uncultured Halomonas sp. TaxID=173971 RepID=UPI00262DCD0B|nr:FxsA family protein [uncultured Halomonas sp.]
MPFLLAFTLFALLDFVILFSVGSQIGLLTTLLLVLATGFIGLHLIRREGAATFARARERLERGEVPSGELLTGAALIFGGALLMAPGFVSDALGFLCLIPDARRLLGKLLAALGLRMGSVHVHTGGTSSGPRQSTGTDWQQASGAQHAQGSRDERAPGGEQQRPLEGDFISRNERGR